MARLEAILESTRSTLPPLRARRGALEREAGARAAPADFVAALRRDKVAVVAEVKRRSPSAGAINEALDPATLASAYAAGDAAAISVLTDRRYFGGSLADLETVVAAVSCPVLRKDFILDEVQLLEARAAGAAAALLIVRVLEAAALRRLVEFAVALGVTPLVEAHSEAEVDRALQSGAMVIGVNARDLDTFSVDTNAAWRAMGRIPSSHIAVAESGMADVTDVQRAAEAGADAVLIGTALAAAPDPAARLAALTGVPRRGR
ncbi:MAG: indole-3-glycerol phosphate synthase TrpC [Gemmatimonadales bacterium]